VLPGGVVADHGHLARLEDLSAHPLARLEIDRGKDDWVVVRQHAYRASRLEPDQGRAPAAHQVAGMVDRKPGELGGVEDTAGGECDLLESQEDPGLDGGLVWPRGSRPHQGHDIVTHY